MNTVEHRRELRTFNEPLLLSKLLYIEEKLGSIFDCTIRTVKAPYPKIWIKSTDGSLKSVKDIHIDVLFFHPNTCLFAENCTIHHKTSYEIAETHGIPISNIHASHLCHVTRCDKWQHLVFEQAYFVKLREKRNCKTNNKCVCDVNQHAFVCE